MNVQVVSLASTWTSLLHSVCKHVGMEEDLLLTAMMATISTEMDAAMIAKSR